MLKTSSLGLAVVMLSAILAPAAQAATIERQEAMLPTDTCQPTAPNYSILFRRNPLSMTNVGTKAGFLTCAFRGVFNAVPSQKELRIGLSNTTTATVRVKCTLVDGRAQVLNPIRFTKYTDAAPGALTFVTWNTADNGGNEFIYPAASCVIPPGVGINLTVRVYDEEIGS